MKPKSTSFLTIKTKLKPYIKTSLTHNKRDSIKFSHRDYRPTIESSQQTYEQTIFKKKKSTGVEIPGPILGRHVTQTNHPYLNNAIFSSRCNPPAKAHAPSAHCSRGSRNTDRDNCPRTTAQR